MSNLGGGFLVRRALFFAFWCIVAVAVSLEYSCYYPTTSVCFSGFIYVLVRFALGICGPSHFAEGVRSCIVRGFRIAGLCFFVVLLCWQGLSHSLHVQYKRLDSLPSEDVMGFN